jgi:hypothetical protein
MKTKLAYVGRGLLNMSALLVVVFGLRSIIRGHVSDAVSWTPYPSR